MMSVNQSNRGEEKEMVTMVEAVVRRINNLCEVHNMSIYELSKLSGVSQSTLNEIMQGRSSRPRIDTLKKVAFGFNMTLSDFFNDPIFEQIQGVDDQKRGQRISKKHKRRKTEES